MHSCCLHCWAGPLQPQRSFGDGGAFGRAPTRALRFLPECDGVPLPLDFILHRALCRVHFWPPALPRAHTSADLTLQRPARFSSSIDVFKEWCEEDLGEAHGVRRREPPRRLCITRWRVDVVVEDMARHTLYVDEPQVLLYLGDVKITPSNPRKAKPRAAPDTSSEAPDAGVPRH